LLVVFRLAVFAFILAGGMVAVMYVTFRSIKMMKGTTLVEKIIDAAVPDIIAVRLCLDVAHGTQPFSVPRHRFCFSFA
jgi:hypothetical protein